MVTFLFLWIELPFYLFLPLGIVFLALACKICNSIVAFKKGGLRLKAEVISVKVDKNAEWDRYYPTLRFTLPDNCVVVEEIWKAWDYAKVGDWVAIIYNPNFYHPVEEDNRYEEILKPATVVLIGCGMIYISLRHFFFESLV
jgi:hypothetical protein